MGVSHFWPETLHAISDGNASGLKKVLSENKGATPDEGAAHWGDPITAVNGLEHAARIGDLRMVRMMEKAGYIQGH